MNIRNQKIFWVIGLFAFFYISGLMALEKKGLSEKEIVVNKIIHKTAKQLLAENDLLIAAKAAEMMEKVDKISVSFDYYGCCDAEIARKLLIKVSETLLYNINTDDKIKKYLCETPFKENNIEVSIFFSSKGKIPPKPYVSIAKLLSQKITFYTGKREFLLDESVSYAKRKTPYVSQDNSYKTTPVLFIGEGTNLVLDPFMEGNGFSQKGSSEMLKLKTRDMTLKNFRREGIEVRKIEGNRVFTNKGEFCIGTRDSSSEKKK